ncbi:MAG: DNA mismatch repair protein MutS [Desulfovibrio sp.]
MFQHYLATKEQHKDALLFYRMGDFYELFFEDAEIVAREVQITLTCRNPNSENKIPMCGVPHHATQAYLAQLLEKGYKIAICDQVEDPKQAKGLVKREVTRILTPGTVVEDANISSDSANYLGALYWDEDSNCGALAWLDYSTGNWTGMQSKKVNELWQWALKIDLRELLLPQGTRVPAPYIELEPMVTPLPLSPCFDERAAEKSLFDAQNISDLAVVGLDDKPTLVRVCGALLSYLEQTQLSRSSHLKNFEIINTSKYMGLDEVTERNLELFVRLDGKRGRGTLKNVLAKTRTPMGARLLDDRLHQPWREAGPIEKTQAAVGFFFEKDVLRGQVRDALDSVFDVERLSTRIFLGRAMPKDFTALRSSLEMFPFIQSVLTPHLEEMSSELKQVLKKWDNMEELTALLDRSFVDSPPPVITDGGLFKRGFNAQLDEFIGLTDHGEANLQELLEKERTACEIPKLKLGFNKVFGYFFEVSKAFKGQVPEYFERKQTLVNSERYVTPELKELEEKMLSASDDRKSLEYKLFQELRQTLADARPRFLFMAQVLAALDYWQCLAEVARKNDWNCPEIHDGIDIEIESGRHPVVEAVMGANYIPSDLQLGENKRILLITGPNMAGKSTVLRKVALFAILSQIGSYVPAKRAVLGLADRVFSRVGASDNLAQGQSTFMVEMTETARILRQSTKRSLVILDEIGRGTSTFDGLALAWAVVEELSKRGRGGIRTLFATHYHELTALEGRIKGLRNLNIAVKEWKGDIVFLRRLVPGPADKSYGIEVARLAGVPQPVVVRAREILASLEEKSQNNKAVTDAVRQTAKQPLLPGMTPSQPKQVEVIKTHPVIDELETLDVDGLTPIEALTLLNQWKAQIKEN